jgi:hypothetical protein
MNRIAIATVVFLLALLPDCKGGLTPQTIAGITDGANFAVCVLGQYAQCQAAKTPWPTCTLQIVNACGGDAVSIAAVVDAHRSAEIQEGFILPDAGR